MISRRWSEWVYGLYADGGGLFGGDLIRVVDTRETVGIKGELAVGSDRIGTKKVAGRVRKHPLIPASPRQNRSVPS
jgi:hypothetical protein